MVTSTASPHQIEQFSSTDRCDRCGARAQVLIDLASGQLLFCTHHFRKHRAVLETMAVFPPTMLIPAR